MKKLIVLLFPLFLFGCKEDEVKKTESELLEADRQLLVDFFAEYEPQGIVRTVHTDYAYNIGDDEAILSFSPHFFDENGNAVTGNIQIEFRELYHKSDFLLANTPTITNNGELLQSAGVF